MKKIIGLALLAILAGCECHGYHAAAYHDSCKAALQAQHTAGKNR